MKTKHNWSKKNQIGRALDKLKIKDFVFVDPFGFSHAPHILKICKADR